MRWHPDDILQAAATSMDRIYAANCFSRKNISIVDQQFRTLNLCYALSESKKLRIGPNSHIAIIGAGFSGMTCAVALAARHDCVISVFESEPTLLKNFREAGFRYLHPDLNARERLEGTRQIRLHKSTTFPFLNWFGDYAPLVAEEIVRKFNHYRMYSNIALHIEEVIDLKVESGRPTVILKDAPFFFPVPGRRHLACDVVIIATGFGSYGISPHTNDVSYWHSGNPEYYWPILRRERKVKERILISGNGDSGVIELAHFLIGGFAHDKIFQHLPDSEISLLQRANYADEVRALTFRSVEQDDEEHPELPGPISWYWRKRANAGENSIKPIKGRTASAREAQELYDKIHLHLSTREAWSKLEHSLVETIEKEIEGIASFEICRLIKSQFSKEKRQSNDYIYEAEMKRTIAKGREFCVTMIGKTPTVYSRRQAPSNWMLLGAMQKYGKFQYIQGVLGNVKVEEGRKFAEVHPVDYDAPARRLEFDRLIIRHGPKYNFGIRNSKISAGFSSSKYRMTSNNPVCELTELFNYFRTIRWYLICSKPIPFDDTGSKETQKNLEHLDETLLNSCLLREGKRARRLFKLIKTGRAESKSRLRQIKREFLELKNATKIMADKRRGVRRS
ncbi:NAD(P)-binding protein [Bradyrhizobium arachidis]|uniref:NAD(P)-binding protein n=1 Tax=Bradyrhizobium arachidis TaxID=858423 RepID=UPI002161CEF6|nr:NAD(P)-binding protein [Bradyrhizobium arachidis]UVO28133.1 NAD(P)-binding protein [Bradyrhizobium arachidis]